MQGRWGGKSRWGQMGKNKGKETRRRKTVGYNNVEINGKRGEKMGGVTDGIKSTKGQRNAALVLRGGSFEKQRKTFGTHLFCQSINRLE